MTAQKHTPINRDEKCAFCSFPRHAHWGGPQALVSGRCAGFESSAATKLNSAAPKMLEALKLARDALGANAARDAVDAAIARAEGHSNG